MQLTHITSALASGDTQVIISTARRKALAELVEVSTDQVVIRRNGRRRSVHPGQVFGLVSELHPNVVEAVLGEAAGPQMGRSGNTQGNWGRRKGF